MNDFIYFKMQIVNYLKLNKTISMDIVAFFVEFAFSFDGIIFFLITNIMRWVVKKLINYKFSQYV